uniref:ORAI calcium release-activated calcium modulator 2 n=1 Tax=Equus asinus TaxID=9793 RepID=A0A8C4MF98_EQUAS
MASSAASSVRPPRPKKEPQALVIPKNAAEEQKLKLERLMKNPDKAVPIPEKMSEWAPRPPPEFVRDVMGSSAGAGSGEFHVYRHLRRREYQRQDYMDAMAEKQKLDAEFQKRLERNKIAAEEQTAKRRKKRQKLKEKKLMAKKMKLEQKKQEGAGPVAQRLSSHVPLLGSLGFAGSPCCGSSQSQEQPSSSSEEASGTEEEEEPSFIMGR